MNQVQKLKFGEDFEWYPTKQNMIDAVINDLKNMNENINGSSILEIGAGDCRVIQQIASKCNIANSFVIEKAKTFISKIPLSITLVGTDFYETDLSDKESDVIFCNPPYSDYATWFMKIVDSAFCSLAYLVVPERWKNNDEIAFTLKNRNVKADVILSDDFLDGERAARAKVDVIRLNFTRYGRKEEQSLLGDSCFARNIHSRDRFHFDNQDPFNYLFTKSFGDLEKSIAEDDSEVKEKEKWKKRSAAMRNRTEQVNIEQLVLDYDTDFKRLIHNYKAILSLDVGLLRQLGVDIEQLRNSLKEKIRNLKLSYWNLFFNVYQPIYRYCTSKTVRDLQTKLAERSNLEFTISNLYAMTTLVLRYADEQKMEQLIDWFYTLADKENIAKYKSNQRIFKDEDWRYSRHTRNNSAPTHFKLSDYRIVTRYFGTLSNWYSYNTEIAKKLNDIKVIARTLGLNNTDMEYSDSDIENFEYGKRIPITFIKDGKYEILAEVKFFKNGNAHLFLHQDFTLRLNVEVGRLLGWLKSKEQAADETGYESEQIEEAFGISDNLLPDMATLLPPPRD